MVAARFTSDTRGTGRRRVLIVGAGVAALEAALALEHLARSAVDVRLIAPERDFVYRPLAVGEPFGWSAAARRPVADLLRGHAAEHLVDSLAEVFPRSRHVLTGTGLRVDYDALLVAAGGHPASALPGALCFGGPDSVDEYRRLLGAIEAGEVRHIAFALPRSCQWGLPLYELALMTATWLFERRVAGIELPVVTHEAAPLEGFGGPGSEAVSGLLERNWIGLEAGADPLPFDGGRLQLGDGREVRADAVVTVPRLGGLRVPGLLYDINGFLPVDAHGRVLGAEGIWAAGDCTDRPVKQGGLAAQQADAAAESIAAWFGMVGKPEPYRPVLRGLLMTGADPEFLRSDTDHHGRTRFAAREKPLWWPPSKVAGRYLAPVLAAHGVGPATAGRGVAPTRA